MDFPEILATDDEGNFLIATAKELLAFATYVNTEDDCTNMTFKLADDIDLSFVKNFEPIGLGYEYFNGTFDGDIYMISNLKISAPENHQGLFGYVGRKGTIQNVTLKDAKVSGKNYIGGLIGNNEGKVTNCRLTGTVSGNNFVGGLVGENKNGTITNCTAIGTVNGEKFVGRLVGENKNGTITNCTAIGIVNGDEFVGRLVGENKDGTITNCTLRGIVNGDDAELKVIDTSDEVIAAPVTANDKEITLNIAIKISAQGLKISDDAVTATVT